MISDKVTLEVVEGPMAGKHFEFEGHSFFILGREPNAFELPESESSCLKLSDEDARISRQHFLLETNPPDVCIRDLGSLNGTYVNGIKYGAREKGETPEDGRKHRHPEVSLKNGDRIQVGDTVLAVRVELSAICCQCGSDISDALRKQYTWVDGTYLCAPCKEKMAASLNPPRCRHYKTP